MRSNLLYDKVIPSERYEQHMAPILIQGIAALEPASFDQILARVTRLKVMKPTRNMTPQETTIFIEDITEHIHVKGINYQFIDRGIFNLIEQDKDKWFPDVNTILEYVQKDYRIFKSRIMMLNELLLRRREQKQITSVKPQLVRG